MNYPDQEGCSELLQAPDTLPMHKVTSPMGKRRRYNVGIQVLLCHREEVLGRFVEMLCLDEQHSMLIDLRQNGGAHILS